MKLSPESSFLMLVLRSECALGFANSGPVIKCAPEFGFFPVSERAPIRPLLGSLRWLYCSGS